MASFLACQMTPEQLRELVRRARRRERAA